MFFGVLEKDEVSVDMGDSLTAHRFGGIEQLVVQIKCDII